MMRNNYAEVSGIVLDRCVDHGTWVEHGQAIKLAEILSEIGTEKLLRRVEKDKKEVLLRKIQSLETKQTFQTIELRRIRRFAWVHAVLDLLDFM